MKVKVNVTNYHSSNSTKNNSQYFQQTNTCYKAIKAHATYKKEKHIA